MTRSTTVRHGQRMPRDAGFTLIEVLVVVVVIGMLAALVAPDVFRNVGTSRVAAARSQISMLEAALDTYRLDNDSYPSAAHGLDALRREPSQEPRSRNWRGPYLRRDVPLDPWQRPYVYRIPSATNPAGFDLMSYGRDGRAGGTGEDEDIMGGQT